MYQEVMQELQGLPKWRRELTFESCTWPLKHAAYKELAEHVPTEYSLWDLGFTTPCIRRLESIMLGADQRRRADALVQGRLAIAVANGKAVRAVLRRGCQTEYVGLEDY